MLSGAQHLLKQLKQASPQHEPAERRRGYSAGRARLPTRLRLVRRREGWLHRHGKQFPSFLAGGWGEVYRVAKRERDQGKSQRLHETKPGRGRVRFLGRHFPWSRSRKVMQRLTVETRRVCCKPEARVAWPQMRSMCTVRKSGRWPRAVLSVVCRADDDCRNC